MSRSMPSTRSSRTRPAPRVSKSACAILGHELFNGLFAANTRTLRLWGKIAERLDDLRVEIVTDAEGATALPWELLRDPDTDTALALHAQSFVRAAPEAPRQALALEQQPVIRILLVICRPGGGDDVPFRSVASRLIKGLSAEARQVFQLDVLRPPTFARLGQVLREAKAAGKPYHVVHFDGHGVYGLPDLLPVDADAAQVSRRRAAGLSAVRERPGRPAARAGPRQPAGRAAGAERRAAAGAERLPLGPRRAAPGRRRCRRRSRADAARRTATTPTRRCARLARWRSR